MSTRLFGTDGVRGTAGVFPLDRATVARLGAALVRGMDGSARPLRFRSVLPLCDIVLGTEDEIKAAVLTDTQQVERTSSVSDTRVQGDVAEAISRLLARGPEALVQKRGQHGARLHVRGPNAQIEVLGTRATVAYGPGGNVELIQEQGTWRIEDF